MTTAKTQDEFPGGGEPAQGDAWEALAQGELSREEEAFLRALAEESEPAAARLEAFAPLGDEFKARTVDRLADDLARQRQQKRFRMRSVLTWSTGVLAAAAAALFAFLPRGGDPLPVYTLAVHGVAEVRGSEQHTGPVRLVPQSELEIVLTPGAKVQGEVVLTVGLIATEGKVVLARKAPERASSGAFRLTGTMDELFGPVSAGRYQLATAVARQAISADELTARATRHDPGTETAQLVYEAPP
jgi:hypothetical protein